MTPGGFSLCGDELQQLGVVVSEIVVTPRCANSHLNLAAVSRRRLDVASFLVGRMA